MDLAKSDSEDGFICSTPRKRIFSNIVTSTPTSSETSPIASEATSEKRRKVFCAGSPNWDAEAPDSDGFDSFEDDSPTRTPKQNSFELTCNELKLVNSVVQETELLIKEIDNKLNPEANTALIQEKKEILRKELSQLLEEKSILENSVKSRAASYDAVHIINDSFLNDTVLSNLNSTLKNVIEGKDKSFLDGTIINISDQVINPDPYYISSTENTIISDDAENIINHSVLNDTVVSNLNSTLKNEVEGNEKSYLDGTIINISDQLIDHEPCYISSTENTIICNDAVASPREKKEKKLNEILSKSNLFEQLLQTNASVQTNENERSSFKADVLEEKPSNSYLSTEDVHADKLDTTLKSSYESLAKTICENNIVLREIEGCSGDKLPSCELKLSIPFKTCEPKNDKLDETLKQSSYAVLQELCLNNNNLREKAKSAKGKFNTASKSTQTDFYGPLENNSVQKSIDFDNSIIIINENVIHKFDEIKSESEFNSNTHGKRVDILKNFHEKLQSICVVISSLQGKHNSSENIKLISKNVLSKCEVLINKIRSENNSLLESNEDSEAVRGMINIIKQNAQYAYEVIHAIVHKTDLKSVRAPFISENNKENVDNYDPRWAALKQLETDEERYKAVRKRWLNLGIPDPHSNLTYRTRRYPCLQNNNMFQPSGNESRTEYYEVFFETKAKNIQDNYDRSLVNLNWKEKVDIDQLFLKHKQEQDDLLRNCHSNMYQQKFSNMYYSHMQETRMLKADYGNQRHALLTNLQLMQDSLCSQKHDAYSFLKFYDGLNGQKSLKISKTELQEALETDDMISKYEEFYKG